MNAWATYRESCAEQPARAAQDAQYNGQQGITAVGCCSALRKIAQHNGQQQMDTARYCSALPNLRKAA